MAGALLQATLTFTTIARGSDSRIPEPRQVAIRSMDEWRGLWKEHRSGAVPVVDFSTSMVVGVFTGSRPTAGYHVDIVSVRTEGALVVVEYRERSPGPDALVAQMLTSPFHLVSLPRNAGTVQFRKLRPPA
ncbi:MAG TPA: protease complex subunit PrcB family protein [Vicinamibacterales bacterium]|nr:protease complex subunit PrcB family protein [Vicinamibacterales bacterium]